MTDKITKCKITKYKPGTKPIVAACKLIRHLRVRRSDQHPVVKAGFTLLEKKGLVTLRKGFYEPASTFWDDVERWGLTSDGYATDFTKETARTYL